MHSVTATDARSNFAELLGRVGYGKERIAIERRGRPFAVLVPVEDLDLIEGHRAQAQQSSAAQLRAIMDNAPVEIYLKDTEGRYLQINRRYEELWGVENDEARGKLPHEVHAQEDFAEAARAHDLAVLESGQVIEQEDEALLEDGRHILHMIKFPVRDAAGETVGLGAIASDVTERRRSEETLRQAHGELERRVEARTKELQEANEALRISEAQYRRLVHSSPNGIFVVRDARFVFVNPAAVKVFGAVSADDLIGRPILDLVHPDWREAVQGQVKQVVEDGAPPPMEQVYLGLDGRAFDVEASATPIHYEGRPAVMYVFRDITERKAAEEALKRREAQLRHAQIMAKIGTFIWDDLTGRCAYCSEELAALVGMTVSQFMEQRGSNESILSRIHADDRARYEEVTGEATENATPYDIEYRVFDDAGKQLHWREIGEPVLDQGGRVVRTFGTVQDITDIKSAQEALRVSQERLSQATRLARLGHWVWDAIDDKCLYCSEEHARVHGLSVDEYMERSSKLDGEFAMVHPEDREDVRAAFKALRAGRGFEMEYRVIAPSGQSRHVREIAKPLFDESGTVTQEFGTIQDITEMKQAEERLRQAQKMEAVGQLTGGVAHDFNNLLAVILGNAEVLQERHGKDRKLAQAVIRAATRGAELTQRLLAFSRQQPLRPRRVDLDILVAGMSDLLARTLGETIEVDIVPSRGLRPALADPGQVENALLNLAINAQHAMPAGGKLTIETADVVLEESYAATQSEVDPGGYVMLAVTDTGIGMAREDLAHAFEPFFTTKEVGQGSGLGLSMVYGFAKQSGGHVAIYSEEGKGTTVKLYLPHAEDAVEHAGEAVEHHAPRARGERILVLEDDPEVRVLIVSLLEDLGYDVLAAPDGNEALAVLGRASRVDLLLSDVVLPGGMSGLQLAKAARGRDPRLKVIFMSGYAEKAARYSGPLDAGAEVLSKPFCRSDLARSVRAVLDEGAGHS